MINFGNFAVDSFGFKLYTALLVSSYDFSMKNVVRRRYVKNLATNINRLVCLVQIRDAHNQVPVF